MAAETLTVALVLKTNDGATWTIAQIRALQQRGHRVVVVMPGGPGRLRSLLDEMDVECVDSKFDFRFTPRPRMFVGLLGLRRQLRAICPSVLMYHLIASALASRISSLAMGIPRVHMVPGPLYLDSILIRFVERFLCRLDDVVIGGSAYTAARYRSLGLAAERVEFIPYGVDLEKVSSESVDTPDWHSDPAMFQVIMVAFVYAPKRAVHSGSGIKGHDDLLKAWAEFSRRYDDVQLLLVGGGFDPPGVAHRSTLIHRIEDAGLERVEWMDTVSDARGYYMGADLSVSPSLSENHGAALEASAMRVPSIVSNAGALPETVLDGTSGWIVPKASPDALLSALIRAREAWKQGILGHMGDEARRHVESNFDQALCAERVADVVERAAAGQYGVFRGFRRPGVTSASASPKLPRAR